MLGPRWAYVLVLLLLTAGCLAGTSAVKPTTHRLGAQAPAMGSPADTATIGGWTLDCTLGGFEQTAPWNQTCEARASHNPGPKEETWLAINPTNPLNVVIGSKDLDPAYSNKCVWNGVSVTHDSGKTWKDVVIGGKYAERAPGSTFYGYACNTDPDFQFTKDGALHYGVEMYGACAATTPACQNGQGWKILLATSTDGGDTWPQVITYQPDMVLTTDYSRMTVNPVTQAIIESIGSVGGCHVLVSKDGGKTATFNLVRTPDGSPCSSGGGAIAVSPSGTVVIIGGGVVFRSADDGMTWLDTNKAFTYKGIRSFQESKYRIGTGFELAYDLTTGPNRGRLYAAYHSADHDEADVFVRSSKDDGKTWSPASQVNVDDGNTHQWMPNLAVAADGSVHVFYFDKQFDPAHKLIDISHAVSFDGGLTWKNQRVSSVPFDGDLGVHQTGVPFIGDYIGVAAVGDDVWAGYPDASNGVTTVIAASHVHLGVPKPA